MQHRQIYRDRNGPVQKLDMKNLPPGHCIFKAQGKMKGLIICNGHPYDLAGRLLPLDVAKLRADGFMMNEDIQRQLALNLQKTEAVKVKNCHACSAEIPLTSKFCAECGTSQQVWVPGSDAEGDALSKLIDPENPLGSLDALSVDPTDLPQRETPDEIFARLNAGEAQATLREMPKSALSALGSTGEVKAEALEFGKLEMAKKPKKK